MIKLMKKDTIFYILTFYFSHSFYSSKFIFEDQKIHLILILQIYKVDLATRDVMVWKEPGQFVSEPIFVPRRIVSKDIGLPNNSTEQNMLKDDNCCKTITEDDGVVIFTLLSSALQKYVQV